MIQDWHEFFNHTPQNPEQFTPTEPDYNESLLLAVAWSLGRLSPSSADAIATLTSLMQADPELTRYRYTCCWAALRLWQIDPGNSQVISVLVDLLSESVSGHWKVASVASSILSDIGKGNVEAIKALTKKLQAAQENEIDEDTDAEEFINAAQILGIIDPGNQDALKALTTRVCRGKQPDRQHSSLLETDKDEWTQFQAAWNLGEIEPGNQKVISTLTPLLQIPLLC